MITKIAIGWDKREDIAYRVCEHSLQRHTKIPLKITPLILKTLKEEGLYKRKHYMKGDQRIDMIDNLPFSTEFSFSRFMIPFLFHRGWVLFCDCDFLFMADVVELNQYLCDDYAVMVVKHNHVPKEEVKMDGCVQSVYPRKNWSSFVLWNLNHPSNMVLTLDDVNTRSGSWLHGFSWLPDEVIGEIPLEWNWLEGTSDESLTPKAVHFTRGGPWFKDWQHVRYADEWNKERELCARVGN